MPCRIKIKDDCGTLKEMREEVLAMRKIMRSILAACAVLAMFFAPAAEAENHLLINGKELGDIQDIMTEMTGTRNFRKHSLVKTLWYRTSSKSDSGSYLPFYYYDIDIETQKDHERGGGGGYYIYNSPPADSEWTSGMHPAISTKPADGKNYRIVLPDFSHHGHDRWYHTYTMYGTVNASPYSVTPHASNIKRLPTGVPAGNVYPTDSTAGLFVGGESEESFVVARMTARSNKHLGDKDATYDCYLEFLDGKKLNGTGDPTALSYNTGSCTGTYPVIRVVAGDFDHDGKASEVAYIRSDGSNCYFFEILKVTRSGNYFSVSSRFRQQIGHRDTNGRNIEGCDIVAGDFDGDGYREIAVVYNDLKGSDGHAVVQIFYPKGGSFSSESSSVRNNDHRLGGTNISVYDKYYGLVASAGDLDGDGRDEIVYAAQKYGDNNLFLQGRLLVSVWGTDSIHQFYPSEKNAKLTDIYSEGFPCMYRTVSLAVAPVSGNTDGSGGSCADLFVSTAASYRNDGSNPNDIIGDSLYLLKSGFYSSGTFKEFSKPSKIASGKYGWAMGLVTADFAGESLILDEPTHIVMEDKKTYAAIMQTPPYHVDYIQAPWDSAPGLTNFSYKSAETVYSKSSEDSAALDTKFEVQQFSEKGINAGLSGEKSIKKLLGFTIGGNANVGWKKTTSAVQTKANDKKASVAMSMETKSSTYDNLLLYKADFHIWRYPVIGQAPPELFGKPSGGTISGKEDGTQYLTYTMSDKPTGVVGTGFSSNFDDYSPIHEEGNLFSYPTKVENTPGYADKQVDYSFASDSDFVSPITRELTLFNNVTGSKSYKTTVKNEYSGSLSLNLGAKVLNAPLSANASFGSEIGDSSTYTKSYQKTEKFQVKLPSPNMKGFLSTYVDYLLKMGAYSDAAGVINMAFAVDLSSAANAWLWRLSNGSVYSVMPDPSLVLPGRYGTAKDSSDLLYFTANIDRYSATQIRGIRFYDEAMQEYSSSALTQGRKYKISFPVYNASFVDAGTVTVEAGYTDAKGTSAAIGRYNVALGGWEKDTENNKAKVEFEWTVPANMATGYYDFYFQIDPDNQIKHEVHKNWNTTVGDPDYDPGGNNRGCYPFAVLSEVPSASLTQVSATAAGNGSLMLDDRSGRFTMTIDGMSFADFRRSISDRTDDFRAFGTVTYNGNEPLRNVYVHVVDHYGTNKQRLVADRYIPALFPGASKNFSFMVSPSNLRNANLQVSLTAITEQRHYGSGGGCDAGFGMAGILGVLALAWGLTAIRKTQL